MYIAMNRFRVTKGSEAAFEQVWLSRDTHLDKVPGFVEFHLLRGPEAEDHTIYASHTVWTTYAAFVVCFLLLVFCVVFSVWSSSSGPRSR